MNDWKETALMWFVGAIIFAVILGLVFSCFLFYGWFTTGFMPQRRLNRATIEKRILVEQARAERDSAIFQAEAEVERAKGVAESNDIVNDSLTPEYLRYHYINTLSKNHQDVIYIPTEAGLPVLEAGKR